MSNCELEQRLRDLEEAHAVACKERDELRAQAGYVAYLCDGEQCEKCSKSLCVRTRDIRHAKNFQHLGAGYYIEREEKEKTDMNEKKEIMETAEVRSMSRERFVELLEEIDAMSANTMGYKNDHLYAAVSEDRLHNFRQGAAITGTTPAQTALAYMAKHLSALIDKVQTNDFHDREDLAEKCQDIINYVKFVWLCANDELDWEAKHGHR